MHQLIHQSKILSVLDTSESLYTGMDKIFRDNIKFILHRNKWASLNKSYSYLLHKIRSHLQNLQIETWSSQSTTEPTSYQVFVIKKLERTVKNFYHTMRRGERAFHNYCIPINCHVKSLHSWLVNTAIHLITSTDILDSHLHDLLWSYATFLLSFRDHLPISGFIAEICQTQMTDAEKNSEVELWVSAFLEEEIYVLDQIWEEANVQEQEDYNLTVEFLDERLNRYNHEMSKDNMRVQRKWVKYRYNHEMTKQKNVETKLLDTTIALAGFIKQKLSWSYQEKHSNSQTDSALPKFLWREKTEINIEYKSQLGSGSFGNIYLNHWMDGRFAGKQLKYGRVEKKELEKEAKIQSRLSHPNFLHLVCCSWCQDGAYLLTELIDQPADLYTYMRASGIFSILFAVELMLQIAKGMEYLHSCGIMHRDLKSKNILVKKISDGNCSDTKSDHLHLKIADFGTSKWKSPDSWGFSTKELGSRQWMAPEVMDDAENQQGFDSKYSYGADVYSFAIVCWEILTGSEPFRSCRSLGEIKGKVMSGERPDLPSDCPRILRILIEKCWHMDPMKRPSFKQICNMLRYIKACLFLDIADDVTYLHEYIGHPAILVQMFLDGYFTYYTRLPMVVAKYKTSCKTKIVQCVQNVKWDFLLNTKAEIETKFKDFFERDFMEEIKVETGHHIVAVELSRSYRAELLEFFLHKADESLGITDVILRDLLQICKIELEKALIKRYELIKVVMGWRAMRDVMDYHLLFLLVNKEFPLLAQCLSNESNHFWLLTHYLINIFIEKVQWENLKIEVEVCLHEFLKSKNLYNLWLQFRKIVDDDLANTIFKTLSKVHPLKQIKLDNQVCCWRIPKLWERLKETFEEEGLLTLWSWRCDAICPGCGSACFLPKDHNLATTKHDCIHQPIGISGKINLESQELIAMSCLTLLESRQVNLHSDWKSPPSRDPDALQVREHILFHHQERLMRFLPRKNTIKLHNGKHMASECFRFDPKTIEYVVRSRLNCRGINIDAINNVFLGINVEKKQEIHRNIFGAGGINSDLL